MSEHEAVKPPHGGEGEHGGGEAGKEDEGTDLSYYIVFLAGVIVVSVIFETFTGYLERKFKSSLTWSTCLQKIYKELMILGFISFIMGEIQAKVDFNHEKLEIFEFVHKWIFIMALFFVFLSVVQLIICNLATAKVYKRERLARGEAALSARGERWPYLIRIFYGEKPSLAAYDYAISRRLFMATYKDSIHHKDFEYASYLRCYIDEQIVELLEIETSTWFVMIFLMFTGLALCESFWGGATIYTGGEHKRSWIMIIEVFGWIICGCYFLLKLATNWCMLRVYEIAEESMVDKDSKENDDEEDEKLISKSSGTVKYINHIFPWNSNATIIVPLRLLSVLDMFYGSFVFLKGTELAGETDVEQSHTVLDVFLMFLPMIVSFLFIKPVFFYDLAFVRSIAHLNDHMANEIVEQAELFENTSSRIRAQIVQKMCADGNVDSIPENELSDRLLEFWASMIALRMQDQDPKQQNFTISKFQKVFHHKMHVVVSEKFIKHGLVLYYDGASSFRHVSFDFFAYLFDFELMKEEEGKPEVVVEGDGN